MSYQGSGLLQIAKSSFLRMTILEKMVTQMCRAFQQGYPLDPFLHIGMSQFHSWAVGIFCCAQVHDHYLLALNTASVKFHEEQYLLSISSLQLDLFSLVLHPSTFVEIQFHDYSMSLVFVFVSCNFLVNQLFLVLAIFLKSVRAFLFFVVRTFEQEMSRILMIKYFAITGEPCRIRILNLKPFISIVLPF